MKSVAAILGCAMLIQAAAAQAPQRRSVEELIAEQQVPIARTGNMYSGPGWERLLADAAGAQFFLVGEQHGTADIAEFALALQPELARLGYTHAAMEVGPYSTDFAEGMIRSRRGSLADYIRQPGLGFVFPFLFFQEEVDLAERFVAASPDRQQALWGLDQEFVGAGPVAAELLRRHAGNEAQRRAAEAFAVLSAAEPMLVGRLTEEQLAPLASAFPVGSEGRSVIEALRLSSEIYAPFVRGGSPIYPANLRRENYMKTNFVTRFAEAERRLARPPRVFLKFGGNHAMRGHSGTDVPGLGAFLAEWGLPRGFGLVNIMVDCAGGEVRNPQTNETAPCKAYFGENSAFASMPRGEPITLVDLRPLRAQLSRMTDLDPRDRQTILAFDYYMVIRDVRAAMPTAPSQTR